MQIERVVLKDRNEEKVSNVIKAFIDAGWVYIAIEPHGKGFILTFEWESESLPSYPEGYNGNRADC